MVVWKDGINADLNAKDFKMETLEVNKKSVIKAILSKGGGWVAHLQMISGAN
ncbi:glycoside hydrolase family 97 C-terminal domain-containing protein [Desertivirga xinjiangensis]|uniref:glycoside hydrolase family 97 C-terminal domain-containing protein n=1 Tax=Desertivirga xinjiangensis TaxID=539206 RepID=UPI0034E1B5FD